MPFTCPKGTEAVPKRPFKVSATGGCDSMSGGHMQAFSPKAEGEGESDVDPCCQQRQACGMICGTTEKFCEEQLQSCMIDACDLSLIHI